MFVLRSTFDREIEMLKAELLLQNQQIKALRREVTELIAAELPESAPDPETENINLARIDAEIALAESHRPITMAGRRRKVREVSELKKKREQMRRSALFAKPNLPPAA